MGTDSRLPKMLFLFFACTVVALQVTPESPCAAICLDQGSKNVSDPLTSNTFASDIVCRDNDYTDLEEGRKYKTCMRCLQESSASKDEETDQSWFIYNLRFTMSSCLYDWSNSTEDACSTPATCGSLQNALQTDNLDPSKATWPYCSTDDNTLLGSKLETCITCLRTSKSQMFMANFLVALQAGCIQRPSAQVLIGVDGDLFSETPAKIANSGNSPLSPAPVKSKGLSQGAIIGIGVGVGVLALIGIALLVFLYLRKNWHQRGSTAKMSRLASPLDPRFGSPSISSPNKASYGDASLSPRVDVKQPISASSTPKGTGGFKQPPIAPRSILKAPGGKKAKLGIKTTQHTRNAPSYPSSTLPTHEAYITSSNEPVSPISATSTLAPLPFSSPIYASLKPSPQWDQSSTTQQPMTEVYDSPRIYAPALHSSQARKAFQDESVRIFVPTNFQDTPESAPPLSAFHTQGRSRTHSQSRPGARARSRSRSGSRSRSKGPGRSDSTARERVTALAGVGNSNASQQIPLGSHASDPTQYQYGVADNARPESRGYEMKERPRGRISEDSPCASDSEQWPGNY